MKSRVIAVLSTLLCVAAATSAWAAAPLAPQDVTRERISDTQTRLLWSDFSDNEDGFEILRRTVADANFESRGTVGPDVTEFIDDTEKGTVYIYEVVAFNEDGDSDVSNDCYVNRTPPPTPVYFNARLIALTVIRVSWSDRSNGEKGFEIQRADFGKAFKTVARVDANVEVYDDHGLSPANTYTYRVRAIGRPGICWDNSKFTVERTETTVGGKRVLQVEPRGKGKGTVTSIPAGISCGPHDDHCTALFPLATIVKLVPKPNDQSRFAGWADYTKCADSTDPCPVYLGQSRVIGAAFRLKKN